MYASQESNANSFELKGLNTFKTIVMLFILLKIIAILLYLVDPIISVFPYALGTVVLAYGVYALSKNNNIKTGLGVLILFIFAVIFDLVLAILNTLLPHYVEVTSTLGPIITQLGSIEKNFVLYVEPLGFAVLLAGMFMVIAAWAFNGWVNETLHLEKPFRTYLYFGWIFFIGEIIVFVGYVVLAAALNEIIAGVRGLATENIAFPEFIIAFGTLVVIFSFIVEIIAGVQILRLINKSAKNNS